MNRQRILCLVLLCVSLKLQSSTDFLSRLDAYAKHTLEYPQIDNVDWEKPDFTTFYTSQKPTIWSRFKTSLGLQENMLDLTELERVLQELTAQRNERGFHGEFVQKLVFGDQGRLVIFGDLKGAYHSLVRSLKYLVTQDVFSHELILEEGTYAVFNGNVIDAAAYNIEALTAVLGLMQRNPEHVIYIRGKNESNIKKEDSKLYQQLSIIAPHKADQLFDRVIAFFDTLPMALYVRRNDKEVLKIFSQESKKFDDERLGHFLSEGKEVQLLHEGALEHIPSDMQIGAIIESHDYSRTLGLKRYVGPPTTWQVFSSPTGAHRRLYGFFNDAFAIVDSAIHFHDWIITLYVNDLQTSSGFDVMGTYNLSTGVFIAGKQIDFFDGSEIQKFESMVKEKKKELEDLKQTCKSHDGGSIDIKKDVSRQKQTLSLGSSSDLSKASKGVGQVVRDTLEKIFENKNKKGGIQNVFFRTIFLDDAYSPDEARDNYKKLIDDLKVDLLFAPRGTATTKESLDFVRDGRAALFFPLRTEASIFRTAALKNAVSLTVSYYDQAKALIDYLFKHYQPKKIAFFYQNDDFGKDGLAGAKEALQKYTFTEIIELPYERNEVSSSAQIKVLEQEQPDAIGFFSLPAAAADLINGIGVSFLAQRVLFGFSDLRDQDFLAFLQSKGLPFFYTSTLPNWATDDIPLVKEFKQFAKTYDIKPDPFSFEAYVIAQVFFYLIEHVEGPVTKEKLMQAAEKINDIDFKGLKLHFDPETRVLLDSVWIAKNNDEPWTKVSMKEPVVASATPEISKEIPTALSQGRSDADRILTLGTSFDLSKTLKKAHELIKDTLTKIFEEKNKAGGVHGLLIRDIFLDDAYTPSIARQNYLNLLNNMQVDLIFGSRGTPTTQEALDLVKDGRMALLFLIGTESSIFRSSELKNAINLTASFYEQGKALIDVLLQDRRPEKIAFFYQDDNFGKDGLAGAKEGLKKQGFTNIIEIPYPRGQVEFSTQADIIKKEKPDAIGLFSTPLPAAELIKSIGAGALAGKMFFGPSVLREQDFLQFMRDKGLEFIYANSLPDWQSNDLQIAQEYRNFASENNLKLDSFGFEAYIVAHLLFYLIEQIEGPVTKEKIIQAAEKIHNYNFRGLFLDFNSVNRILLNEVWVIKNNHEPWIKIQLDVPKVAGPEVNKAQQAGEQPVKAMEEVKPEDAKPVIALHGDVLLLGNSADSSKGLKPMTEAIRQGMELAVRDINAKGGVNDIRIKIDYLDDEYTPELARSNMLKFLDEYKTNLFIGSVGTAPLDGYIDMIKDGKIALFFPFSSSSDFRVPDLKNILHYTPSYSESTGAATKYILKKYATKKWALLYQNDLFGTTLLAAMRGLLNKNNITEILDVPFERNDVNFTDQVAKVTEFNPDVVGFYGPAISAQGFLRVANINEFANKVLYGLSWLSGGKLESFLKEKGLKMIIPCALPDPKTSELPIAQKFRKKANEANIALDVNSFEGYLDVELFAYMLKQVQAPITIRKIMRVAENMKDFDFEGLKLNYDPALRQLSHTVWLDLGTDEEWIKVDLTAQDTDISKKVEQEIKTVQQDASSAVKNVSAVKKEDEKPLSALQGDVFVLGNTADVTKGLKAMSEALRHGLEAGVNELNAQGGIKGLRLKIIYLNDEYEPAVAKENVEKFLNEYNTNVFISSVGTPTLESYINLVADEKIAVFFPFTGSSTFRKSELKNLLNFGPSYDATTGAATKYILKTFASKRWVLLYQNDNFGIVPKNAIKALLEKQNIKDVLEVAFERNDVNFTRQAKEIVDFKPEVIGFFGPAISAQEFIRVAGVKNLSDKILYGLPWLAGDKLQNFLAERGLKMIIPNVLPNPKTSELPIVKEFRKAAENKGISLDVNAFEGYVNVRLFAHMLKQVDGEITIEKIMRAAEGMKDVDFGGLKLNFDPQLRQLSHYTWLDLLGVEQEWLQIDLDASNS